MAYFQLYSILKKAEEELCLVAGLDTKSDGGSR
jgi:hypothetical protein